MKHIIQFSGGVGSWAAAKRVAETQGTKDLILLFADTLIEDEDLYRFMVEASANVGGELVVISDGRTPWEVFHDVRFLGNSRIDPCSMVLKRELLDRWIKERFSPDDCICYVGIDWTEIHRYEGNGKKPGLRERKLPYRFEAPMIAPPYLTKLDMLAWLKREGIKPPRLYEMGFPHNNCGGFCVKAGQGQFKLLLDKMPDRFAHHEAKEQELRDYLGKDVTILKRTLVDGDGVRQTVPMTLRELRETVESNRVDQLDLFEFGGCGCAID